MVTLSIQNQPRAAHIRYAFKILLNLILDKDTLSGPIEIIYAKEKPSGSSAVFIKESDFWDQYGNSISMPKNILVDSDLVILYGDKAGPDIIAATFFMLTRYEELFINERDKHNRVPAHESCAYKYGFLDRPIVNEYAEYLFDKLKKIHPSIKHKENKSKILFTHDVDKFYSSKWGAILTEIKNLLRLRWSGFGGIVYHLFNFNGPANTFDFLHEVEGNKSVYYLMAKSEDGHPINMSPAKELIEKLKNYGSDIGIHPDKPTLNNKDQLKNEIIQFDLELRDARNHFLLFDAQSTWDNMEALGLKTDSTLAYAEKLGFRAGICSPYLTFSLTQERELDLIEIPLTMMDVTLFGYLRLSPKEAINVFIKYLTIIRQYQGAFVLLWHNFSFDEARWRKFYIKMIEYVKRSKVQICNIKELVEDYK